MKIPPKTREEIAVELNFNNVKTMMRHLKTKKVVLPERCLLLPQDQKLIYEALGYPNEYPKEWYAHF